MHSAARLSIVLILLVPLSACGRKIGPSEIPVQQTEVFTGTIAPLGASHHVFTVDYAVSFTDASLTLTSLTKVSDGSVPAITIGLAFGNISGGVCTRASSYTRVAVSVNQLLQTDDRPFITGPFCVQIFDNPAQSTVTEPLNYTLQVVHY